MAGQAVDGQRRPLRGLRLRVWAEVELPCYHRHALWPTLSGKRGEIRSRFGRCTVAGVEVWMAQPLAVVIVTDDPAALIDSVVPDCLNCTTCVGGLVNR